MNRTYTATSVEHASAGWVFWLKWVLGSTGGWLVVFMLSFSTIGIVVEMFWGDPETVLGDGSLGYAAGLTTVFTLSFTALGSVQWLLLRHRLERIGGWAPASGLGGFIVAVLAFALMAIETWWANEIVHNGVAGVVVGLLQWRLLCRQTPSAHLWIPAAALGFVAGGGGAAIVSALTGMDAGTSNIFGVAAMSALTGSVMSWLLAQAGQRDPVKEKDQFLEE